jgi:nicotinamidase-related amidase
MNDSVIDIKTTAIVVIDLQLGIASMPVEPYKTDTVVQNAKRMVEVFRKNQALVFLVHVGPSKDGKDTLQPLSDQPMQWSGPRPDNWMDFVPEIGPEPTDLIITKRQWGAFHGTELDLQLRRRGISTIILCGIATNIGVESTARFAFEYGYSQIIVEDACSARSKEEHEHCFKTTFPRIARIRSTDDVLAALRQG